MITSATSSSIFPPGILAISGAPPVDLLISTPATTNTSSADIVDISALGQLLSATSIFESGILQTTATTPSGFATLATATQLFVDAFNGFLQSGSNNLLNPPGLSLGNLFAQALASRTTSNGTSVIASLSSVGINFVPPLLPNGAGQLTIDLQSLQSAFNADPVGTSSVLSQAIQSIGQLAVEISNTAVQLENLTQIGSSLTLAVTAGELTNATAITTASLIAASTTPQTTTELLSTTGTPVTTAQTATELLATAAPSIAANPLVATTTPATTALPTTAVLGAAELPTTTVSTKAQPATALPATTTTPSIAVTPSATITTPVTTALPTVTEVLAVNGPTAAPVATQNTIELPTTATAQIVTSVSTTTTIVTALPTATAQLPAAVTPAAPASTEVPFTATPATTPAVSALPTTPLTTPPTTSNVTPTTLINRAADASDPAIAAAIMAYHLVDGIIDTGARHYTRPPAAFTGRDEVQRISPIHRTRIDLHE